MTAIHAQIKLMFEAVLRQVSPELGKSTKLNLQFARALVNRESQTLTQWQNKDANRIAEDGENVKPVKSAEEVKSDGLKWSTLPPSPPPTTPAPTPPTLSPTPSPTTQPTKSYDWSTEVPADEEVPELLPDPHTPGEVDIDPTTEVPSKAATAERAKRVSEDPVFKHLQEWYLRNKQAKTRV